MNLLEIQKDNKRPRKDGRLTDTTLRPLSCEISCSSNCDGSALWKCGGTSVMATVHGPIAPKQYQYENPNAAVVSIVIKSGSSNNASAGDIIYEREYEHFIKKQLLSCIRIVQYPRCVISITLQIINADGSILAASIHACLLALMDASIEMHYLPISVSCCICSDTKNNESYGEDGEEIYGMKLSSQKQIFLDPSNEEEHDSNASLTFVFSNKDHESINSDPDKVMHRTDDTLSDVQVPTFTSSTLLLLGCHTTAAMKISTKKVLDCWCKSSRAVRAIDAFIRLAIEQKVKRESQTVFSS